MTRVARVTSRAAPALAVLAAVVLAVVPASAAPPSAPAASACSQKDEFAAGLCEVDACTSQNRRACLRALKLLRKRFAQKEDDARAECGLGWALMMLGRLAEGEEYASACGRLSPPLPSGLKDAWGSHKDGYLNKDEWVRGRLELTISFGPGLQRLSLERHAPAEMLHVYEENRTDRFDIRVWVHAGTYTLHQHWTHGGAVERTVTVAEGASNSVQLEPPATQPELDEDTCISGGRVCADPVDSKMRTYMRYSGAGLYVRGDLAPFGQTGGAAVAGLALMIENFLEPVAGFMLVPEHPGAWLGASIYYPSSSWWRWGAMLGSPIIFASDELDGRLDTTVAGVHAAFVSRFSLPLLDSRLSFFGAVGGQWYPELPADLDDEFFVVSLGLQGTFLKWGG